MNREGARVVAARRRASPRLALRLARTAAVLAVLIGGGVWYVVQPLFGVVEAPPVIRADAARLAEHVRVLAETIVPRDAAHPENLERASAWVRDELASTLGAAELQPFDVAGRTYHNVLAHVGPESVERLVVGAHYDACEPGVGADDNASGVAGLLELARLLKESPPLLRVDLVAYALEEPPYFRTPHMGSAVHAASLRRDGVRVRAMIALEMIGFYRDEPESQEYPAPGLRLLYPSRGNFIAVVGRVGHTGLAREVKRAMAGAMELDVRSINAPSFFPGIDFSDHRSYWNLGYEALMVTDTAFYRNPHYHRSSDRPETLDFARMAQVVEGVHAALLVLDD